MSATRTLLVELLVEELPPRALKKLGEAFAEGVAAGLQAQGLRSEHSAVTPYASPRRLGVQISAVREVAPDRAVSQKLMPVSVALTAEGQPTPALLKKLASLGLDASVLQSLERRPDGKAESLFHDSMVSGTTLSAGLQKALDDAIAALPIPKLMTYQLETGELPGWTNVQFVRPAHGLVALHGADVVPVSALGLAAGRETRGHRFEALMDPVVLQHADHYATQLLEQGAVIASFAQRHGEIVRQLQHAAAQEGLTPVEDEALLDEVTALVERPNVLVGRFEESFLDVPPECLILTMKANQKYFPLLDAAGSLTNRFLLVSNIRPADPSAVIQGNERVVRPRLADAKFFFDQDRRKTLESRVAGLARVVYHGKLGSQGERAERVQAIANAVVEQLRMATVPYTVDAKDEFDVLNSKVVQAAQLAKADLLTDMVGEFPELQGVMGGYYARHEGLRDGVAIAIEDHYKPRFAGDALPRNHTGSVLALADKLETLVGLFGIGQPPTGDKDPFALRRHALGVIRILAEKKLKVSLNGCIEQAVGAFPHGMLVKNFPEKGLDIPLAVKVKWFVEERAASWLRDRGYSAQEVDALMALAGLPTVDLLPSEYEKRLSAVRVAREHHGKAFSDLASADKRARNILVKSGGSSEYLMADASKLVAREELQLLDETRSLRTAVDERVSKGEFEAALLLTLQISEPIVAFFDAVMVNVEDSELRSERFRLLHEVTGLTNRVVDLSRLAA